VATTYKTIFINYATRADVVQGKEFSRYAFRTCQTSHNLTSAVVQYMATQPYKKYYMLNMDYAYGRDVAKAFKEQLKAYIPEAQIVGEDFHPINNKDFAPYIAKVISSKADAIFTGNLGNDLILLVKQARALGLKVSFPFVITIGIDPYLGNELKDDVAGIYSAISCDMRVNKPEWQEIVKKYHEKHKNDKDFLTWWPFSLIGETIIGWKMTFAAIEKAGSLAPEKIIEAFEGFTYKSPVGMYTMRKCDHQVILPMFAGVTQGGSNPYFNGTIRQDVKFPWIGPNMVEFPGEKVVVPATADYNPRCK
jgi:ABC-type branched-subunit amino acid transport system substrate-binding protein